MKIIDCFTFYNELDLLHIRLEELYSVVDHFVLVEATTTFTNRPKEMLFQQNQDRYAPYLDKIIYVPVDLPKSSNAWDNERAQRNAILRGIEHADANDIIIVSDCDEIPRASAIEYLRNQDQTLYAFRMPLFNFKFNYMRTTPNQYDVWAMAAKRSVFNEITPDSLRNMRFNFNGLPYQHSNNGTAVIEHSGWHFGYLGNNEYLRDKAQSFSHQEVNTPEFLENIDIETSIRERKEWDRKQPNQYEIVNLNDYFPNAVKQYTEFILEDSGIEPLAFLPQYPYNK